MAVCFGLVALFGVDPRKRSRRIDESEKRQPEFLGKLHQTHRLAISYRLGHAEIAHCPLLGIASVLMAAHPARMPIETRQAAAYRQIVGIAPDDVHFMDVGVYLVLVILGVRPLWMPRDLRHLPRRELG